VCVCGLDNNVVSVQTTPRRMGRWLMNWKWFARNRLQPNQGTIPISASTDWEKLRKTSVNRCPGRDSNPVPPEYRSRALPICQPARNIIRFVSSLAYVATKEPLMGFSRSLTLENVTEIWVKVWQGTLVGSEVFTALTMKSAVYWGLTRLALLAACLFLIYFFDRSSTLKMAAISSSETSVDFLPNYTRCYNPEGRNLQETLCTLHMKTLCTFVSARTSNVIC
jgi:hypothetical protein